MKIAGGEPVPWTQDLLRSRGHAIECRVYAEDPTNDFLPQAGRVLLYREPTDPGIRLDAGVREGSAVPVQYDPLLVKLIAAGETRRWARQRAADALRRYAILGVRTKLSLLQRVLEHPRFVTADIATGFLNDEREALVAECSSLPRVAAVAAAAAHQVRSVSDLGPPTGLTGPPATDPWTADDTRRSPTSHQRRGSYPHRRGPTGRTTFGRGNSDAG